MTKTYLWQAEDFPHFYYNPAVVKPLEVAFKKEIKHLDTILSKQDLGFEDVLTEEILANSEIEGVLLDRESVYSSSVQNVVPTQEKEKGAVALTQMALESYDQPLSHGLLHSMHRKILKGSTDFPPESIGAYVGRVLPLNNVPFQGSINIAPERHRD